LPRPTLLPYTPLFRSHVETPRHDRVGVNRSTARAISGPRAIHSGRRLGGRVAQQRGPFLALARFTPAAVSAVGSLNSEGHFWPSDRKSTRLNSSHVKI